MKSPRYTPSSGSLPEFPTLVHLLRARTAQDPGQRTYTFLVDGEQDEASVTNEELDRRARAIGAMLQRAGHAGERVLLLYPPGLDFIAALFGCLYGGAIAVPVYPPMPGRLQRTLPALMNVVADARPTAVLATAALLRTCQGVFAEAPVLAGLQWLVTDGPMPDRAEEWHPPAAGADTLAVLQYTSGSTGRPRGVMLSHQNLLHNSMIINRCFGHTERTCGVVWLPPYHDMGLIGGVFQCLYSGGRVVLMSPVAFLQRPVRWLQAISRYRAATSGGPNFAYQLCVRRVTPEQRAALDLSAWEVAFNGAEPVRSETLREFAAAFASRGFRWQAFYPCYGLAEGTLMVSGPTRLASPAIHVARKAALEEHRLATTETEDETTRTIVGCGASVPGQRIAIVDPASRRECPPGRVGEIWVSGPSVAQGYWDRPEETDSVFRARLAEGAGGPFLRTGDLGVLRDGELLVTGRMKDQIIIRGRNHYAHDVERTVEQSHAALLMASGAAFAVDVGGEEELVVVHELDRHAASAAETVIGDVRQAVAERHDVQPYAVVLVRRGGVPKTSSGKIRRAASRQLFLTKELPVIAAWRRDGGMRPGPAGEIGPAFAGTRMAPFEGPKRSAPEARGKEVRMTSQQPNPAPRTGRLSGPRLLLAATAVALGMASPARAATGTISLRFPTFTVPAHGEREVCTFIPVRRSKPFDLSTAAVVHRGVGRDVAMHHFMLWVFTGDDLKGFPNRAVQDTPACIDYGSAGADKLSRDLIFVTQSPRTTEHLPLGLARRLTPIRSQSKRVIGFFVNSHWFNNSDRPVRARVKVKLKAAKRKTVKRYVKSIFESSGNVYIDVPPFAVSSDATWAWGPGQIDIGGKALRGAAQPTVPGCVTDINTHMHKRGTLYTLDFVDRDGSAVPLFSTDTYREPSQQFFDPPLLVGEGQSLRYTCRHDNGMTTPVKLGCEEAPGVPPGTSVLSLFAAGLPYLGGAPKRCLADADCAPTDDAYPGRTFTGRCVPANLVFGFTSDDEMCILLGSYYDADPTYGCDLSALPPIN